MTGMDSWDIVLLVAAAYIAVMALVRMMRHRYNTLIGRLQKDFQQEQDRKQREELAAHEEEKKRNRTAKKSEAA